MTDFESSFPGCEEESLEGFPGSVACPGSVGPPGLTQPESRRSTIRKNEIVLTILLFISVKLHSLRDVPRRFLRRLAAVAVFFDLFGDDCFDVGIDFVYLRNVRKKIH